MSRSDPSRRRRGQALVELAVVLPLLLLLGCGAVGVVQVARTQMAINTAANASALVGARGLDAVAACSGAHQELTTVLTESGGLLSPDLSDQLGGSCVGSIPNPGAMPAPQGGGSYALWFGYGASNDSFCRVGSAPQGGAPTDGDVVATLVYRPNLDWIPLVGGWLSPRLSTTATEKIDPFRSRDPKADATGDNC
ncbi:MAG: TadE/TadG family type IV pilus assembly protein [Candidatus Dormibacteria bacterium]